jgi:GrpB-like predicted nucleotidyltransferase (UPF0157 family)
MVRKIIVVPHDPAWSELYRKEAEWLKSFFGEEIVAIHHFGSTSLTDIYAKPIIDILIEVRDICKIDAASDRLYSLSYLPKGEFGISGRRFFIKGDEENRTHHLHFYEAGNPEIARHLDFRDYMAAHPDEAHAYSLLKIDLARCYPEDIDGYNAGKTGFIKEIDRKVKLWRAE